MFTDTSALVRAYIPSEPDHDRARRLLFDGPAPVVASELVRVEMAAALAGASRIGRVHDHEGLLARFDADAGAAGRFTLLRLRPDVILPRARRIVLDHTVRTLDAIHLAVALEDALPIAGPDGLEIVTGDRRQAEVASALGLRVHPA